MLGSTSTMYLVMGGTVIIHMWEMVLYPREPVGPVLPQWAALVIAVSAIAAFRLIRWRFEKR